MHQRNTTMELAAQLRLACAGRRLQPGLRNAECQPTQNPPNHTLVLKRKYPIITFLAVTCSVAGCSKKARHGIHLG